MTEVKSITNIYYDCLERIFDCLDLESLLNVAGTCKRLQVAAAAKFGDEYGGTRIWMELVDNDPILIRTSENDIAVQREVCLPFLRCFGAKIMDLCVYSGWSFRAEAKFDIVQQYVNQYCADTLTSVAILGKLPFSNEIFRKPFKNVGKVYIGHNDLKDQLPNFVNWFPNMRRLTMCSVHIDANASDVSFPQLEHLKIISPFSLLKVAKLLRANEQLKSLSLNYDITMREILDMIGGNTSISILHACRIGSEDVTKAELNRFANEHLMMIELELPYFLLSVDDVIDFIKQMGSLKKLRFQIKDRSEYYRLQNQIGNEWQHEFYSNFNRSFVCLMR